MKKMKKANAFWHGMKGIISAVLSDLGCITFPSYSVLLLLAGHQKQILKLINKLMNTQ